MQGLLKDYRAPWWLPGGHAQTIWAAKVVRADGARPALWQRERWTSPDGDFIDVDLQIAPEPQSPWLVMFHGLEGSSSSHYARAFAAECRHLGWHLAVPHFRGCSGELNLAPRAYHSGDHPEIAWILARLRQRSHAPVYAVGVSLGGNALLRWAQEMGAAASATVASVAAVSSPLDLAAAGAAIDQGLNALIYGRMFLATMKPKAWRKWQQHPGLFDLERVRSARTLRVFDDAFTARLHGFAGVDDYYARCSAKPHLRQVQVPALVVNALNDPFVPAHSLPRADEVGAQVRLWQPRQGGHVGFPAGRPWGHVATLPRAVARWLHHPV